MFDNKDYSAFHQNSQESKEKCGEFYQNLILSNVNSQHRFPQNRDRVSRRSSLFIEQQLKILLETRQLTEAIALLEKTGIKRKSTVKIFAKLTSEIEVAA